MDGKLAYVYLRFMNRLDTGCSFFSWIVIYFAYEKFEKKTAEYLGRLFFWTIEQKPTHCTSRKRQEGRPVRK